MDEQKTTHYSVNINGRDVIGMEYYYEDDPPSNETLEDHAIELLKEGALGDVEDFLKAELTFREET